jgi:hypothetical protein
MKWFLLAGVAWGWDGAAAQQGSSEPLVLFDFEKESAQVWDRAGGVRIRAAEPPETADNDGLTPAGRALLVETEARGRLAVPSASVPANWLGYEELQFWVYRPSDELARDPQVTFEILASERDGIAWYWRRVDLDHQGWQRVALPLKWFRQGPGRLARWDRVDRIEFRFREPARLWIDTIALRPGFSPRAAEWTLDDLRALAFPDQDPRLVRSRSDREVVLLTDAEELDLDALAAHLARVAAAVRADFPWLERPASPPVVIVFATPERYRAFPPALGERLNAKAPAPRSAGYTVQGLATSTWDARQGSLRPVYTHEFVHALLERSADLGNRNEWIQEGVASRYQLRFHPQRNFVEIVRTGIADPARHLPLRRLLSGEPIPADRYWQAATVVDLLLADAGFRARLPELIDAFRRVGSTNIEPHLGDVLGTDWERLEAAWRTHCQRYDSAPTAR